MQHYSTIVLLDTQYKSITNILHGVGLYDVIEAVLYASSPVDHVLRVYEAHLRGTVFLIYRTTQ